MKEIPLGHSTRGGCSLPDPTLHRHTHKQQPTHNHSEIESNMSSLVHSNRAIRNRNEEDEWADEQGRRKLENEPQQGRTQALLKNFLRRNVRDTLQLFL